MGKRKFMGVYLDVLQVSGVWKHCKYIIFVLRASLSVFISFLSHLKGGSVSGANLLIEVNQGLQSIKSTTISFPTYGLPSRMNNSEPFEQEVERMNTEVVRKKKVRTGHRCHLKKMCTTVDNILKEYNPSLESELLSIRECLVRKAAVISKLDEELRDSIEDENEIAEEINAAEEFQQRLKLRDTV